MTLLFHYELPKAYASIKTPPRRAFVSRDYTTNFVRSSSGRLRMFKGVLYPSSGPSCHLRSSKILRDVTLVYEEGIYCAARNHLCEAPAVYTRLSRSSCEVVRATWAHVSALLGTDQISSRRLRTPLSAIRY